MANTHDTAQCFSFAVGTFLRTDEEYRAAWRYRHRRDALRPQRREALKNASAWAETLRSQLEAIVNPDTIETYAGKALLVWNEFAEARNAYLDQRTAPNLEVLKSRESTLKTLTKALNKIISTYDEK